MAEAILLNHLQRSGLSKLVSVDSAGVNASKGRSKPDSRAQKVAVEHGLSLSKIRSRRVELNDFKRHTHILAMDLQTLNALQAKRPDSSSVLIDLILAFDGASAQQEVPDPYYGNQAGFTRVFELLDQASSHFVDYLQREYADILV